MIAAKKIELIVRRALNLVPRTSEGVVSYDVDNLYPQRIANLIDASKTATACCDKAKENIICEGFVNEEFAARTNEHSQDMNDVLEFVADEIPRYRGYALIVQYGGDGRPLYCYPVPFSYVRAVLNEDYKRDSIVRKWRVFDNWERETLKDTNVKTGVVYPNFNPKNFWKECEEYGGIENHPGQLYYANFSNRRPYPISPFHAVQPEMGAEHGNALYVENVLARGFHACSVVSHGMFQSDQEQNEFRDAITEMMGVEGTGAVLTVRDENVGITEKPFIRVDQIGTPIDSDLYKSYCEPLRKDIAISCFTIPIPLIDSSLISFSNASGEVVKEMQRVYRRSLSRVRDKISRDLAYIFDIDPELTKIKNDLEGDADIIPATPADQVIAD